MASSPEPAIGSIPPPVTLPHLPEDAEHLGLSQWTAPELMFVSQLDGGRRRDRIVAWTIILMFIIPTLWATLVSLLG